MSVHYKFGLLLIFLLLISKFYTHAAPTNQSSSAIDDYDYKDEYDDDDEYYSEVPTKNDNDNAANATTNVAKGKEAKANDTTTTTTILITTSQIQKKVNVAANINYDEENESKQDDLALPKRSNHVLVPKCPKRCSCLKDYTYIQCSNADLIEIPHDLPKTATHLDLSQNHLSYIKETDFANCTKLLEINLSKNQLTNISKEIFQHNQRLKKLLLSNNHLTHLDADTFSNLDDLETLDLSHNLIELPENVPFLNQPRLLELICRNCSWTQLYDETFENLSSLTTLKIDQNDFNKKINTEAFKPLKNLIKLRLPTLDRASVTQLCNLLKSIDNISFRHFDVSCYELVLGYSYDESLIQTTDPPNSEQNEYSEKAKMSDSSFDGTTFSPLNENISSGGLINDGTIARAGIGEGAAVSSTNTTATAANDNKAYQVPVSQEVINIMLICIMIIAIIGLAIGLVCRKDVGGIKTKCCRTNKAEPKEDNQQPAEEIPLNKLA